MVPISKFTPDGTKTTFFSKIGWPYAMAIDGAGNLFVGDMSNHLILKFTPDGEKRTLRHRDQSFGPGL